MSRKILYASDLDQTLIFSKKYLQQYPVSDTLICVESRGDTELSYMCKSVIDALADIASNPDIIFIPSTTRDIMRFKRVELCRYTQPEYAIVNNGGVILHHGVPMQEWNKYISALQSNYEFDAVKHYCSDMFTTRCTPIDLIDSTFLMFKIEDACEFDCAIEKLSGTFKRWQFTRQGHKCYIIPECVTKGAALQWLSNKLKAECIFATGDGPLDVSMLDIADVAVVPDTSELSQSKYEVAHGGAQSAVETISLIKAKLLANKERRKYYV